MKKGRVVGSSGLSPLLRPPPVEEFFWEALSVKVISQKWVASPGGLEPGLHADHHGGRLRQGLGRGRAQRGGPGSLRGLPLARPLGRKECVDVAA